MTTPRRLALVLLVFLAWAPAAYAWSWPVQGPVVRPFAYDESHPYAAGQHRGIDIGADAAGETVAAPAAGTVSFAGTVPTNGRSVTIETADGYSVTLTHLGSIAVAKGATVAEQEAVGTVGPSGTPEVDGPYVHLGIRLTADPNGYVDPLTLLPAVPESGASQSGSTGTQPSSSGAASSPPVQKPSSSSSSAPPAPKAETPAHARPAVPSHEHRNAQAPETGVRPVRSAQRPASRDARTPRESRTPHSLPPERTISLRRSLEQPAGLDVGHEPRPSAHGEPSRREPSSPLPALVCDWAAALFALGAAFAVRRRAAHRRPTASAQVLRLGPSDAEREEVLRAA